VFILPRSMAFKKIVPFLEKRESSSHKSGVSAWFVIDSDLAETKKMIC